MKNGAAQSMVICFSSSFKEDYWLSYLFSLASCLFLVSLLRTGGNFTAGGTTSRSTAD
jgi:hypothetical protein